MVTIHVLIWLPYMYVGVWAGRGVPEAHHPDAGSQGDPARFGGAEGLTPGGKGGATQRGGQVEHQDQPAHRAVQQDRPRGV